MLKSSVFAGALALILGGCQSYDADKSQVQVEKSSADRSEKNKARDQYRHPTETLSFFDVQPEHAVVEIWPGGGWYAEILAPILKSQGTYIAAHFPADSNVGYYKNSREKFEAKLLAEPQPYDKVVLSDFAPPSKANIAPAESVDRVLTFRNVHNWMRNDSEQIAFDSFYKALKPGGILGVVEHRAPDDFNLQQMVDSGYVSTGYVIKLAEKSGFKLLESSEINANAKDTKNHPKGVWTLPPTLRLKDQDKAKYLSIGESDRMTLKFIKSE